MIIASIYSISSGGMFAVGSFFSEYIRLILNLEFVGLLSQSLLISMLALGWIPFKWLIDTINSDIGANAGLREWAKSLGWLIAKIFCFSVLFVAAFFLLFLGWSYLVSAAFAQVNISDVGGNPDELADFLLNLVLIFALVGLVAVMPIVGAALIFVGLLLLRALRPWLQPATLFVLDRLYQSKQGVLTQVALGLGFIAKFIQEILKYTNWLG